MKLKNIDVKRLYNKARKSQCAYKISAMGINKFGDMIGIKFNSHRFVGKGAGMHAEMSLMNEHSSTNLKTIIICRSNNSGTKMLPIHPCETCSTKAKELGIKIISLYDLLIT